MKCVGENEDGSPCLREAVRKQGAFWVCEPHGSSLWNYIRLNTRDKLIYEMVQNRNISRHTLGITYFAYLPNGNMKIGYSRDATTLSERIRRLSSLFEGNVLLVATVYGGESMEAFYHYKFKDYRISAQYLEQFICSDEIIQEVRKLGMVQKGREALAILGQFEVKAFSPSVRDNRSDLDQRRSNVRKVYCPECNSLKGVKCVNEDGSPREANHSKRAKLYSELKDSLK